MRGRGQGGATQPGTGPKYNIHGYLLLHHHIIMDLALDPHVDPIPVGTVLLQRAAADVKEALHIEAIH